VGEAVFSNFEEARLSQPASDLAILLYTSTERSLRYSLAKSGVYFSARNCYKICALDAELLTKSVSNMDLSTIVYLLTRGDQFFLSHSFFIGIHLSHARPKFRPIGHFLPSVASF
jgi:hypothetical protein